MSSLVSVNRKITPASEGRISPLDRGFLFGDSVYEAGRSYDRVFLFMEEHWERFRRSAKRLEFRIPWPDDVLTESLCEASAAFGKDNVSFRTIVSRGENDSVGIHLVENLRPTLVHVVQDLTAWSKEKGICLLTSSIRRTSSNALDPAIKSGNYLNSLLALQEVKRRGGEDAIMLDRYGFVTEGTNFSVLGVTKAGEVITPSLGVGILESITRKHVLDLARRKLKTREGMYDVSEFYDCSEVFIVSSTREIVPVRTWDAKEYSISGPVTKNLSEAYQEEVREYTKGHRKY